jgi:hypothetical protein
MGQREKIGRKINEHVGCRTKRKLGEESKVNT